MLEGVDRAVLQKLRFQRLTWLRPMPKMISLTIRQQLPLRGGDLDLRLQALAQKHAVGHKSEETVLRPNK